MTSSSVKLHGIHIDNQVNFNMHTSNWYALRDLVPFTNREKHPWKSATFSKVAGF